MPSNQTSHSSTLLSSPDLEIFKTFSIHFFEEEVWKLMETHAREAHGEDPGEWSADDRKYLGTLIKES